ncbi:hypothetical protein HN604_01565 [archaeon]|jgi:hypothetical protein|nr:hypothetical protein [archaeon]MBT6606451.1 hypothetical protein [archaeon]MBT7251384.1 hypothetical protein [archaeon]MBT7660751.1 hypothetical protein [archaeon]
MGKAKRIYEGLRNHVVDSTTIMAESFPFFAAYETKLAGMEADISMNAKYLGASITYAGLGFAFSKGRDVWRKKFKISDRSKEKLQAAHDILYTAAFNGAFLPALYYSSGERDLETLAVGTGLGIAVAGANSYFLGSAIDIGRDLTGIETCDRKIYPHLIKDRSPKIKKSIAAGLVVGSIGLMSLIYNY